MATPRTEADVAALVAAVDRVLPVGAQSSLTGGATPRGEVVLSTRALTGITLHADHTVHVGAGVPLAVLQRELDASGLYYPPVPTYDGAFVGGTIATNAAGAATFKYGSTRDWVSAITVVLASGDVLDLRRGDVVASPDGWFDIECTSGSVLRVPAPSYAMPDVRKLSAGYYARPGMDLVDLFIGSEGTLGIVVDAVLRVVPRPRRAVALVGCQTDAQALALTAALRTQATQAVRARAALDVSAVEYMDDRAIRAVPDEAFARAGVRRPAPGWRLLLIQIDVGQGEDVSLGRLQAVLDSTGIADDPTMASPDDDRGAERLFALREAVPASVNRLVAEAQSRVHPDIQKTAGDPVVPVPMLSDFLALSRAAFERRGLDYAIWGHVSDGNLHPNLIPRALEDVHRGRDAILEIARGAIAMGGAPLAEHGVGRSALKQRLLVELYGDEGVAAMRAVKRALDPDFKLAPGVLFAADDVGVAAAARSV